VHAFVGIALVAPLGAVNDHQHLALRRILHWRDQAASDGQLRQPGGWNRIAARRGNGTGIAGIADNARELSAREFALPVALIEPVCARQDSFVLRAAALFDARSRDGRIVEAHGDLRPEHICLEPQPQIIDCLEFSRDFRTLDPADELAFLALECERLGAAWMRKPIFETYTGLAGDAPADTLLHFYQSYRACTRAKIAIWHLAEPALTDPSKWTTQARHYLRLAAEHIAHCG